MLDFVFSNISARESGKSACRFHGRRLILTSNRNYTSSMTAISAASPRRAPVRITLV